MAFRILDLKWESLSWSWLISNQPLFYTPVPIKLFLWDCSKPGTTISVKGEVVTGQQEPPDQLKQQQQTQETE